MFFYVQPNILCWCLKLGNKKNMISLKKQRETNVVAVITLPPGLIRVQLWLKAWLTVIYSSIDVLSRWSRLLMRAIGCPHPWTAPWRSTSSCWTVGRERGLTGQSLDRSSTCWTSWSATPTPWRGQAERPLSGERAVWGQTQNKCGVKGSVHRGLGTKNNLLKWSRAGSLGFHLEQNSLG